MTIDDLHTIQEIDTEMLKYVTDICSRNGIKYYLLYGTLLGAVRHHGPIPWDDDVDIGMTRENYNKFLKVLDDEISKDERGSQYAYRIMGSGNAEVSTELKFYKKDTLYCVSGSEDLDIMKHVQLDVFVIDYIKEQSETLQSVLFKFRNFLRIAKLSWSEKQLMIVYIKRSNHRIKWVYIIALYILNIIRFVFHEKTIEKLIFNMFVDKSSSSPVMAALGAGTCRAWQSIWFKSTDNICYDDKLYLVPKGYTDFLIAEYGDYLTIPPEDKRYRKDFDDIIFRMGE